MTDQTLETPTIHGTCDADFAPVKEAFAANFAQGLEAGASAVVTIDGQPVVDIWAGEARPGVAWETDTIVNVWSTTKTMAGLCMHLLSSTGQLDFDAPVARYWPEFAANDKEGVLVRHVMGHTSGLSGWAEPITPDVLYDWEKATSLLAAQAPFWTPGEGSGYHAITLGYLQGEILRRITGQTMGDFFDEHFAEPAGADFHIGLDPSNDDRVATLIPPGGDLAARYPTEDSIGFRTMASCVLDATEPQSSAWRRAEIPAAGGHGNARSVSRIHAAAVTGTDERPLDRVFEVQADGIDQVLGERITFGMGFGLMNEAVPLSPSKHSFYWGGWGGSVAILDLDERMTITYVMNKMAPTGTIDLRGASIVMAAYGALAAR